MYNLTKEERAKLGQLGSEHVKKNYNFKDFENSWIELMDNIVEKYGSWDTRKNYKPWVMKEVS